MFATRHLQEKHNLKDMLEFILVKDHSAVKFVGSHFHRQVTWIHIWKHIPLKNIYKLRFSNARDRIHSGERPFFCKFCNESFKWLASFNVHMKTHTGEKPFSCDICNKSFSYRSNFNSHLLIHSWVPSSCYSCNLCCKSFGSGKCSK